MASLVLSPMFFATWLSLSNNAMLCIKVAKINVDEQPELASRFQIMSIPTMLLFVDGKVVKKTMGVQPKRSILAMLS